MFRACFAVVLLSCVFRVNLCAKNTACIQRTVEDHCCRFPFYYKKIKYKRCTYHGDAHNRFWCATDAKYDKNDTGWGYCKLTESQCFVKTTDGNCCIFPFKYRGIDYKNCAASVGKSPNLHWCATKPEFNRSKNGSGWGYCAGPICYTCRSTKSWEDCNNNMAKKTCPYGIEHCLRSSRQETNNITTMFTKDCTRHADCSKSSLRCEEQTSGERCTHDCCYGDLCNLGGNSKADGIGRLASILSLLLAIKFTFVEFQCF